MRRFRLSLYYSRFYILHPMNCKSGTNLKTRDRVKIVLTPGQRNSRELDILNNGFIGIFWTSG